MLRRQIPSVLALLVLVCTGVPQAEETIQQQREKALQARKLIAPPFAQPILLTSVGQGAGASVANALLSVKAKVPLTFNQTAKGEDLKGVKTLVIVVDASSKGLGAAGVDRAAEMARADILLATAETTGMAIVVMHIGGKERRGELSDPFIEKVVPHADYLVVKKDGNEDGYFTQKATELRIPITEIERYSELVDVARKIFSITTLTQ